MLMRKFFKENRGAVLIIVGLSAVVLFGFAALVVDIGYGLVTRNQLQNVADAAGLAGARQLGRIYTAMPQGAQSSYILGAVDRAEIENEIMSVSGMNYAAGQNVLINIADVEIGQWDFENRVLNVDVDPPNAVRVTTRRDNSANGPIRTFFGRILGFQTLSVTALATAALGGLGEVQEAVVELPIGLDLTRFECGDEACYCNAPITFHPTGTYEGCVGWSTFTATPSNASTLTKDIIGGMMDGSFTAPAMQVGDEMEFTGGTVASALKAFKDLYDYKKDASGEWKSTVMVYDKLDCANVHGSNVIVGFANVVVTRVDGPPTNLIEAKIDCEGFQDGRGGGGNFGVLGSIPKLVQ